MRKVAYYLAGTYAEFLIGDEHYEDFGEQIRRIKFDKSDLEEATRTLEIAVREGQRAGEIMVAEPEVIAACYVWWYFNDRIKKRPLIDGDLIILDTESGGHVSYAACDGYKFTPSRD